MQALWSVEAAKKVADFAMLSAAQAASAHERCDHMMVKLQVRCFC